MTSETILTNARIVLADEVIDGSLVMRDGKIAEFAPGATRTGEDIEGDFIIPGLVELHTDHLEGHYAPRPKVRWNPIAAVLAHDAQVATAGITTVFDALRVGFDGDADTTAADMRKLADAIEDSLRNDRLRADHFIHLRCEVSASDCQSSFALFDKDDRVRLASLMDHAPGQRQFVDGVFQDGFQIGAHLRQITEVCPPRHPDPGAAGTDLTRLSGRIRRDWFEDWIDGLGPGGR
jgi:alpha-D-ribose 1-methylphosphonate 5-triphosphate diphosphatase